MIGHSGVWAAVLLALGLWVGAPGCKPKDPDVRTGPQGASANKADGPGKAGGSQSPTSTKPSGKTAPADRPTRYDDAPKVVALGDVHGDLEATRAALRLAGAIGTDSDDWIGGKLVLVQTGDQLDRGDDEQAILDLFTKLETQAAKAGGAVHVLNGNHELMNVAGDLRYVTQGGLEDFADVEGLDLSDPRLARLPPEARARMAAFMPGGPYANVLATRNTVVIVGRSVFVHGGVLPAHVPGGVPDLEKLNADARGWLSATAENADAIAAKLMNPQSVVWTRLYASDDEQACDALLQTLNKLDVDRMVVGHTVQSGGITSGCSGRIWRIDVGMAAHYGGSPQVLVIEGDRVTTRPG